MSFIKTSVELETFQVESRPHKIGMLSLKHRAANDLSQRPSARTVYIVHIVCTDHSRLS